MKAEIRLLVGYDDKDPDIDRVAGYIAVVSVLMATLVWILLVFDYWGHSASADLKSRQEQTAAAAISTTNHPVQDEVSLKQNGVQSQVGQSSWIESTGGFLGTYGDFFGGVLNPILTVGTLVGLGITMLQQRVQLRQAREEAKGAGRYAQIQAFESTFFNMVDLHVQNVQELWFDPVVIQAPISNLLLPIARLGYLSSGVLPVAPPPVKGRAVFAEVLRSTERGASLNHSQIDIYRQLQTQHNDVLGHYFRHLYQILDHIDRFSIDGVQVDIETRRRYAKILRAQLSAHELVVLLINCTKDMVDDGSFRMLLKRYKFLEHLPVKRTNYELSASWFKDDTTGFFFEYFEFSQGDPPRWTSGAFGSNKDIAEFLDGQYLPDWVKP
ncbi:putative phage abortive infection protein [Duganella sp. Leaf61]|uniref:putative phage abortive infection protein n=1 Tax=Duganella sp. Leaf61 TaxID=1736227 RepID=UPI00138F5987|nr:putative phage abortive infection protein [Duganella sp. Leaf61]